MKSPAELGSGIGCTRSVPPSCAAFSASLEVSRRSAQRCQVLQNLTIVHGASWMHLHNCRCFQEHPRMLLQSLRALCLAPVESGSVWKYLEALVRSPGVSGRIECGFRTESHFADVHSTWAFMWISKLDRSWPEFSRSSFAGARWIALRHRLQPVEIYRVWMSCYIDTLIHWWETYKIHAFYKSLNVK